MTCTDVIDELVKSGKEIEAIYFAFESGLTERFPPISLLKSYLKNSKKNASTIMKNGNNSVAASVCVTPSYISVTKLYEFTFQFDVFF